LFERKPHRSKVTSTEALATGAELYAAFRQHIPLTGKLTASVVETVATATGLSSRQVRRLALRFRENPVAASLAQTPRGPKIGSHRIAPEIAQALEGLIGDISKVSRTGEFLAVHAVDENHVGARMIRRSHNPRIKAWQSSPASHRRG
jgi:hypothetical protein